MITAEQKAQLIFLRAGGHSYDSIVEQTGIAKQTVFDTCKKYTGSIRQQRAELVESILVRERQLYVDRIQALCNIANRLRTELETRELSDLSTETIFKLYCASLKNLKEQSFITNTRVTDIEQVDWNYNSEW